MRATSRSCSRDHQLPPHPSAPALCGRIIIMQAENSTVSVVTNANETFPSHHHAIGCVSSYCNPKQEAGRCWSKSRYLPVARGENTGQCEARSCRSFALYGGRSSHQSHLAPLHCSCGTKEILVTFAEVDKASMANTYLPTCVRRAAIPSHFHAHLHLQHKIGLANNATSALRNAKAGSSNAPPAKLPRDQRTNQPFVSPSRARSPVGFIVLPEWPAWQ